MRALCALAAPHMSNIAEDVALLSSPAWTSPSIDWIVAHSPEPQEQAQQQRQQQAQQQWQQQVQQQQQQQHSRTAPEDENAASWYSTYPSTPVGDDAGFNYSASPTFATDIQPGSEILGTVAQGWGSLHLPSDRSGSAISFVSSLSHAESSVLSGCPTAPTQSSQRGFDAEVGQEMAILSESMDHNIPLEAPATVRSIQVGRSY